MDNVILFGPVGSGKTTLLNIMTNGKFKTSAGGYSCTREIQKNTCDYHPYQVVDFPGTDAAIEQVHHVKIQQAALKSMDFTVICLVCQMSDRVSDLIIKLTKIKNLFGHHIENIIVILTKCEGYSENQKSEAKFVLENKMKLPYCFFKDNKTEAQRLSHWIYSYVKEMKKVTVGDGIFNTLSLNALINDTEQDIEIINRRQNKEINFNKIYDITLKIFKETTDRELKRALYFSLKQHMDQITDEYAKEIAPFFTDKWELTAELIIFQNSLMAAFSTFKKIVIKEIEVENTVYNSQEYGPKFKKCACGQIWFRVYGCSSIICGRRSVSKDFSNNTFYSYVINWTGDTLYIKKHEDSKTIKFSDKEQIGLTDDEKKINSERKTQGKILINPIGCGRQMKWEEMIDVTPEVQQQLKEFDIDLTSETDNIVLKHENKISQISGSNKKDSAIDNECAICFNYTHKNQILIPCGHTKYCDSCISKIKICSICNSVIVSTVRIYN
jgi:GTPase SAR1 family protein